MATAPEVAIATSIPPTTKRLQNHEDIGERYQADCVASWLDAGFKVYSVNAPDEIPRLAARFPQVAFVPTDRDARVMLGRKTPMIDDLLLALARQDRPVVGIVNADICMETGRDWRGILGAAVGSTMVIGHRVDVETWPEKPGDTLVSGVPYRDGFDLFFFEKAAIPDCLAGDGAGLGFAMGTPWWDYWFPLTLAFKNYHLALLREPVAAHFIHPMNYEWDSWEQMAVRLVTFIWRHGAGSAVAGKPAFGRALEWAAKLGPQAVSEAHSVGLVDPSRNRFSVELALFSRAVLGALHAAGQKDCGGLP
jgi:hypothetical protein